MILHVYEAATKSNSGDVYVATPDKKIIDIVKSFGGKVVQTSIDHQTGTDRIFEVFKDTLKSHPNIIVNLQGDMPNIEPKVIKDLIFYMNQGECDIGTLASEFRSQSELEDQNVVKVSVNEKMKPGSFAKALDFLRNKPDYAFTSKALLRYVGLKRSKLELERKLEQLRAIENKMSIHVGYINSSPLSVDTEKDLIEVKKIMEKNG